MSFTFNNFIVLLISSVDVLSSCNINFNNLFCVTCIMLIILAGQFPYTSIPYLILEYMNAWYSSLANVFVILYLILLKIPKYLISALPKHSTCSLNRKVSSGVKSKYWNDLTLLIVISLVTIPSVSFVIGLFVAWNKMKLVLSQFIVNLFLTHHKYNSLNFDTKFAIRLFQFSSYMNRAVSSANSLIQYCPTARYI